MKAVIIHCADTPNDREFHAEDIHRWHQQRGWDGIGYHYCITRGGTVERGRPEYWTGAHVEGNNTGTLGICLIGTDEFTDRQWQSLAWLVRDIKGRHPGAMIKGHREYDDSKTCPNFDVKHWWMEEVEKQRREDLRRD